MCDLPFVACFGDNLTVARGRKTTGSGRADLVVRPPAATLLTLRVRRVVFQHVSLASRREAGDPVICFPAPRKNFSDDPLSGFFRVPTRYNRPVSGLPERVFRPLKPNGASRAPKKGAALVGKAKSAPGPVDDGRDPDWPVRVSGTMKIGKTVGSPRKQEES